MSARAPHAATSRRSRVHRALLRATLVLLFAAPVTSALRAQASPAEGTRTRLGPAFGLHVGAPQKVSLALGVGRWRESTGDKLDGVFGLVEPGLGAGRASVGYLRSRGNLNTGLAVRASALRTWRDPWSVAPNRTYVGLEASAHMAIFGVRAGVFRRTTAATDRAVLFTIDAGLFL
jgi:hypothetical protein